MAREFEWDWLTRLKSNRRVSLEAGAQHAFCDLDTLPLGLVVHLREYGLVKLFRTVDRHGNVEHWATNRPSDSDERTMLARSLFQYLVFDLDKQQIVDFQPHLWADQYLMMRAELYNDGDTLET